MANIYTGQLKTIPAWDVDSDRGWTILSGDSGIGLEQLYYLRVPWLYRGVEDRAQNVGAMPWAIFRGEDEVADSGKFAPNPKDDLYFLRNIERLLELYEASMCMTGRAYFYLETNPAGYIKTLKYCAPNTVSEVFDNTTGEITGYKRSVNGRVVEVAKSNMLAVYKPDYLTETGPGRNSAAGAALMAAGALYNTEGFISQFFKRGAIKATILSVDTANVNEAERLQKWWGDVIQGVKNAWTALVMRGKMVTPTIIGEGIDGLQNMDLTTAQRQEISTALGIPESRLWSAAANYATRKEDELAYYRGTILPEWGLFKEGMNTQVFTREHRLDGYRIEPQPENLDVFQEDEAQRAGALQQLTSAGLPLRLAMELLGYDLTEEQWAMIEQPSAPAVEMPAMEPIAEPPAIEPMPTMEELRSALATYRHKCLLAVKRGEDAGKVEFVSAVIPERTMAALKYELDGVTTDAGVKAAFDAMQKDDHEPELAVQLKRANDLLEMWRENERQQN